MKFEEVLPALREGKAICRPGGIKLILEGNTPYHLKAIELGPRGLGYMTMPTIHLVLFNDWQIIDE